MWKKILNLISRQNVQTEKVSPRPIYVYQPELPFKD